MRAMGIRGWINQDQGGQGLERSHGHGLPLRDAAASEPSQLLLASGTQKATQVTYQLVFTAPYWGLQ